MNAKPEKHTFSPDEIAARLGASLPHWRFEDGFLSRTFATHGWKGTLMVINTIGHLAEAAWHHPDLRVSYAKVVVLLQTHDAHGITDQDFELAAKIESVVQWQPGKEGGALKGTPNANPEAAYIQYD